MSFFCTFSGNIGLLRFNVLINTGTLLTYMGVKKYKHREYSYGTSLVRFHRIVISHDLGPEIK